MLSKHLDELLFRAYEGSFRFHFRHHPRCDHIINAIRTNQLTTNEIDELFSEADQYTFRYWTSLSNPEPDENGNVVFKINRRRNG